MPGIYKVKVCVLKSADNNNNYSGLYVLFTGY